MILSSASRRRGRGTCLPRLGLALLIALLVSCTTPTTSTPPGPNSPQTTVALAVNTIADADQAAVRTVISLRDQGKLSPANTANIETWLAFVANTDKSVAAILAKPEPWDAQKKEILVLLATVTAPNIIGAIDPGAQAVITQIQTLIAQLKTLVVP